MPVIPRRPCSILASQLAVNCVCKGRRNQHLSSIATVFSSRQTEPKLHRRRLHGKLQPCKDEADQPPQNTIPPKTGRLRLKKDFADLPLTAIGPDGKPVRPLARYSQESQGQRKRSAAKEEVSAEDASKSRVHELGPDGQSWPPLAKQVLANLEAFPGCILLTRVGGFYESYFDQASLISSLLGVKLASRTWGGRSVGMAGFPLQQLEKYLKVLVQDHGRLVAVCEEFKSSAALSTLDVQGDSLPIAHASKKRETKFNESTNITRRVARVISPGTLVDEKFLDPFSNNFILAVTATPKEEGVEGVIEYGLAWLDVSTADFNTTICEDAESLRDEVARIAPREVVLEPGAFHQETFEGLAKVNASDTLDARSELALEQRPALEKSDHPFWDALDGRQVMISFTVAANDPSSSSSSTSTFSIPSLPPAFTPAESRAVANLTSYVQTRLLELLPTSDSSTALAGVLHPTQRRRQDIMQIDAHTLASLEVREAQREGGVRGALGSIVRRTVTRGGTRLLGEWLTSPSTSLDLIQSRHSLVSLFVSRPWLRDDLRLNLRRHAGDVLRVLQRISCRRNDEQDLLEVRDFVTMVSTIRGALSREATSRAGFEEENTSPLRGIADSFADLSFLGEELATAIDERVMELRLRHQETLARQLEEDVALAASSARGAERQVRSAEGKAKIGKKKSSVVEERSPLWGPDFEHLIRPNTSKALRTLTKEYGALRREARFLEDSLQVQLGTEGVTLRHMLGQGYVVHLSDVRSSAASEKKLGEAIDVLAENGGSGMSLASKSKTTRTYYYDMWTRLSSRLTRLHDELKALESFELERLRLRVLAHAPQLRANAHKIDELDVLLGFAQVAQELNLVRPTMDNSRDFEVRGGRHLSVEMGLLEHGRGFVSNDCRLGAGLDDGSTLHLITGPNMGGKSTYLRQNALLCILAQAGSFVPASSARLGIVDGVFSRVGAKDDLFRDRSTFMVEMTETAQLLRRATDRSLVVADEIGRGTTTAVGLSLAYATLHELRHTVQCRALFATHFHELADMLGWDDSTGGDRDETKGVGFYCTDVEESENGSILYSHHVRPGVNRESHGLKVARLADMPSRAVRVAETTLEWLQGTGAEEKLGKEGDEKADHRGDTLRIKRKDVKRLHALLRRMDN